MNARIFVVLSISLTVLLSSGAQAVGKVTTDPNSQVVVAARSDRLDPRLAQKVTYEAVHKPVKTVIADLARTTGVTINAGAGKQDWQVRDRRMNLFVKDIPLSKLMESIARVMKFRWEISDRTPPTYRLVQDRRLVASMQADFTRKQDELHKEIVRRRQKAGDAIVEVGAMTDAEINGLRDKNPYLYWIGKTGLAKLTAAMFRELPGLREIWESASSNIAPKFALLSPETQQLYLDTIKRNYPYRQINASAVCPTLSIQDLSTRSVGLENIPRPMTEYDRTQMAAFGGVGTGLMMGTVHRFFHLGDWADPDDPGVQLWAKVRVTAVEDGVAAEDAANSLRSKIVAEEKKTQDEWEHYVSMEPRLQHADDPDLHVKAKLKIEQPKPPEVEGDFMAASRAGYAAVQKGICESYGYSVVSDSFARFRGGAAFGTEEQELAAVLEALSTGYNCNWERYGRVIELRNRDWFRKRASQIPDEWVVRWRDKFKKNGSLSIAEFAEIAALEFDQIAENILTDSILHQITSLEDWNMINTRSLLRLYLRLDTNQRTMLCSLDGLNVSILNSDLQPLVQAVFGHGFAFSWNLDQFLRNGEEPTFLRLEYRQEQDGKGRHWFVASKKGLETKSWHLTLPTYQAGAKLRNLSF